MKTMFKIFFKLILIYFLIINPAFSENLKVFNFTDQELKLLEVRKVRGADNKTDYTVGSNDNGTFLKAIADNAASGLGKEIKINLNSTPFINITWKIEQDLSGIIENSKKGHDYAARVFVIKKTGATPLSNRAINYVFSSNSDIGANWPSPYTSKSIDYVLSTTKKNLNEWVQLKQMLKRTLKSFMILRLMS